MTAPKRLSLILCVVLCLALAWLTRTVVARAVLTHVVLPKILANYPGLRLHFQDVDTNLSSRLRITNLSAVYDQPGASLRLNVGKASLAYSLASVLPWRGPEDFLRHLSVDLQGAALEGDFSTTSSGATTTGGASSPLTLALPALPVLPAVTLRDGALTLTVHDITIHGQGLTLSAPAFDPSGQEEYRATLSAGQLAASGGGGPAQQGSLATSITYRTGLLQVPALYFQEALLLDNGRLEADGQGVTFSLRLHLLQSQGLLEGSVTPQNARLSFHLAEADLTALSGVTPPVSGHLRADGEIEMPLGQADALRGSLTAMVDNGAWNGIAVKRLEVEASAAGKQVTIPKLALEIGGNQLTARDGVVPLQPLMKQDWPAVLTASQAKAQLRVTEPLALPPAWSAPFLSDWQALGLTETTATLSLAAGHLLSPQAEIVGAAGRVWIKEGDIELSGELTDWERVPWSLAWQAELNDAKVVRYYYEDWPATGGKAHGNGAFSGTLAEPRLPFNATFEGASLYGFSLAKVTGQLEWRKDRLFIDATANNGERDRLTFQGTIDLDKEGLLDTQVSTEVGDMARYLTKELIGTSALHGPLRGTAHLDGLFSRLTGKIDATGDWRLGEVDLANASLHTSFNGRRWSVKQLSASLAHGLAVSASGQVEANASWRQAAVDLDSLSLAYQGQELALAAPGGLTLSAKTVTVKSPLALAGKPGRFLLNGQLGGADRLALTAADVTDTGLLRQLSGRDLGFAALDFSLELTGSLTSPDWHWRGKVHGLQAQGAPLALDGVIDLAYDARGLWLRDCDLANGEQSIKLAGHLPLAVQQGQWLFLPNPLEIKAKVALPKGGLLPQLFPAWLAESDEVNADINVAGSWTQPLGQIHISASGLKPGPRLAVLPSGPYAGQGLLHLDKDQITINDIALSSPNLNLALSGAITQLALSDLINAPHDTAIPGQIGIQGRFAMPDLAWLASQAPRLRRTAGSASGTFAVSGPLARPEARAELELKNGAARGSDSLLVLRDITVAASLAHEQLTIKTFSGSLGGAPVEGSGRVNGLFSPDPALDLRLTGKDLLLYRADGIKIRANTSLTLAGTVKSPALAGEIMLTDSRITRRVDWLSFLRPGTRHNGNFSFNLFSFTDAPYKDARLNLRIKAARPLEIANNVFKGGVRPDLILAGTGEVPYLTGVIYSDSGRVTLPSGRLDLENGLLRFAEDAPDRPQLEFQATGRMMGYDISAQVRGTYDEPEVTLSSSPPLASEDLLMLLLTGRRPVNDRQTSEGVSTVAVYLGRGLLARLFGEKVAQSLLLDRLEVDVGRAVTQQGEPTVDARVKLADGLGRGNTSLYLTGEKDIWDYYNGGMRVVFHFQ